MGKLNDRNYMFLNPSVVLVDVVQVLIDDINTGYERLAELQVLLLAFYFH